jgi:hypothetical protein
LQYLRAWCKDMNSRKGKRGSLFATPLNKMIKIVRLPKFSLKNKSLCLQKFKMTHLLKEEVRWCRHPIS